MPVALTVGVIVAVLAVLPAWSHAPAAGDMTAVSAPADPWAGFNRRAFKFNAFLDRAVIGPVARVYKRVTPAPVRKGVGNIVSNLREPSTAINGLVQGRPKLTIRAVARFVANSTVGVLGIFDVAGRAGLEREHADFGQTLGRYGVSNGPYLYLPVVGPTTLRDGLGGVVNTLIDPISLATGGPATDFAAGRVVVRGVDARADADEALRTINEDSTDPYATTRSAYLQHRAAVVRESTGEIEALPDFDEPVNVPPSPDEFSPIPPADAPTPLVQGPGS
ncbi:MAG: VacJ family lipoprotein [Caulobacter sp.]|nr:VacJ family lipoprotein [Caulobacter sp.]